MEIKIGNKKIGNNQPVFIVAELGINHNGDLALAKKMILVAKKSGVDAVKLQSFITEDFVGDKNLMFTYKSRGKKIKESQYQMFKRHELILKRQRELFVFAKKIGIIIFTTPQDNSFETVDYLCSTKINMPAIKIGSDDLTNLPMLDYYARKNKPLIISTGMATFDEIEDAVAIVKKSGNPKLIILKCTSLYPTPINLANLRQIKTLQDKYSQYVIGYSDHSIGWMAAVVAVTLGAKLIEKHFTLNQNFAGPDHWFSANPKDFALMVKKIRKAELLLGKEDFVLSPAETVIKRDCRRSIMVVGKIKKGETIKSDQVALKRPGTGLPAKYLGQIIDRKALRNYSPGYIMKTKDLN